MSQIINKQEAHGLIDRLPAQATWEDLMYEIYVREAVERGIDDMRNGRVVDVSDVRAEFGLPG